MKISEIRRVIESLNWNRHDLTGATRDEFRRMDVGTRLTAHILAVLALDIPARFADDKQDAAEAVERARAVIVRWEAARAEYYAAQERHEGACAAAAGRREDDSRATYVNYSGRA